MAASAAEKVAATESSTKNSSLLPSAAAATRTAPRSERTAAVRVSLVPGPSAASCASSVDSRSCATRAIIHAARSGVARARSVARSGAVGKMKVTLSREAEVAGTPMLLAARRDAEARAVSPGPTSQRRGAGGTAAGDRRQLTVLEIESATTVAVMRLPSCAVTNSEVAVGVRLMGRSRTPSDGSTSAMSLLSTAPSWKSEITTSSRCPDCCASQLVAPGIAAPGVAVRNRRLVVASPASRSVASRAARCPGTPAAVSHPMLTDVSITIARVRPPPAAPSASLPRQRGCARAMTAKSKTATRTRSNNRSCRRVRCAGSSRAASMKRSEGNRCVRLCPRPSR